MNPLHLIPASLHRRLYRIAHRLRRYWFRLTGSTIHGCSIVARDEGGRFLLVRHSYGPEVWAFPGGGIGRNERPRAAAIREIHEELGCALTDLRSVANFSEPYLGATNVVHVFTGRIEGVPRPDRREILAAQFFERGSFPSNLSRTVSARMKYFDGPEPASVPHGQSEKR